MVYTLMHGNDMLEDFDSYDAAYDTMAEAMAEDEDSLDYHIEERYESEEAEYWANKHSSLPCLVRAGLI